MLGRVEVVSNVVTAAGPVFATTGLVTGALLQFWVEEDEMLVDLTAKVTLANSVVEETDVTIFVASGTSAAADIAAGTNGLARITPAVAADENTVFARRVVRLAKGLHTASVRVKAPTGVVTVAGTSIPCELMAMRLSHMATLGHGVDSKVQLIQ